MVSDDKHDGTLTSETQSNPGHTGNSNMDKLYLNIKETVCNFVW